MICGAADAQRTPPCRRSRSQLHACVGRIGNPLLVNVQVFQPKTIEALLEDWACHSSTTLSCSSFSSRQIRPRHKYEQRTAAVLSVRLERGGFFFSWLNMVFLCYANLQAGPARCSARTFSWRRIVPVLGALCFSTPTNFITTGTMFGQECGSVRRRSESTASRGRFSILDCTAMSTFARQELPQLCKVRSPEP